ncbi:helix-turn-helix domain-containing protein [Paraburkholderia rhizosphaerae]|nr:helix-turn-helix domain-containing protein [Paraburkholderia rhizosphaerae]
MSSIGLQYRFDSPHPGASTNNCVHVGQSAIVKLDIAWQSAVPIRHHGGGGHLFVQVVRSGTRWIEQRSGQIMRFGPGEVAVVDPEVWYKATVRERSSMSVLRIPRVALQERELNDHFPLTCRPDPASPDVCAVRDFVVYACSQAGKVSEAMLAKLMEQVLDLMDVLVSDRHSPAPGRSNAVTVLRVKQLIARRIGDPGLSAASIAAELNMSTRSLSRVLHASGLSAMHFAWSLRLEHAAQLLVGVSRGEIQTIAYRCGFASPAHFARAFKARYNMTPRDYADSYNTVCGDAAQPAPLRDVPGKTTS